MAAVISRKIPKDSRVIILGQKGNFKIYKGKTVVYYRMNRPNELQGVPWSRDVEGNQYGID